MAQAESGGARHFACGVNHLIGEHGPQKEAVFASRGFRVQCEPSVIQKSIVWLNRSINEWLINADFTWHNEKS